MGTHDPKVDTYIEKAAPFARPILRHLREVVHANCPEVVEETKWGMPHFRYKGMFAGMAAFKEHCTFGFWKHELIVGEDKKHEEAMGSFGRITTLSDLPSKRALGGYVKIARKLNDEGVKLVRKKRPKKALVVPPELVAALAKNKKARAFFEGLSPSHQREYAEWIAEAKGAETKARRLATTLEWLAEGKHRHWKYETC
jgi:uncharacterized protein YdeI (YjbR/CyaY-like superfamily)